MSQHQQSTLIVDQMVRKEKQYMAGVKENHDLGLALASRLQKGSTVEGLLDPAQASKYRERVKALSQKNVLHERKVKAFCSSLRKIKNTQEPAEDYQQVLSSTIEKEMEAITQNSVEVHQEPKYLDICQELGEVSADNQDDELEVLNNESSVNLKCPLSGALLENPVRNKVCKHVYSKQHIMHHLRTDRRCPAVGCGNNLVTAEQLEDDSKTARLVQREKIRQEKERTQQSQHAMDLEEEEEYDI